MKFFKIKKIAEQLKPTMPKPTTEPANGYEWSWDVNSAQWIQVPVNNNKSYNVTDSNYNSNTNSQSSSTATSYTTASLRVTDNVIACLNQFLAGDDFNDGILFINGLKFKPTAKMYDDGLVKYAGYDFMNGSLVKITAKGLDYLKNHEQKIYNKLKKQIDASEIDIIPSTIPGFDNPVGSIPIVDGAYDADAKKFAEKEIKAVKWYNIELEKDEAEKLKLFLKENKVKYEVSEVEKNGKNIIHFEMQLRPELLEKVSSFIDNNINKIFKKAAENDLDLDHVWSIIYKFSDDDIREYMVTDKDENGRYTLLNLKDNNNGNITLDSYWKVSERFIRENVKSGKMLLTYDY